LNKDRAVAERIVKTLSAKRRQEVEQALKRSHQHDPPAPPPPGHRMNVVGLIRYYFGPQGPTQVTNALCVGWRESRYIPTAVNKQSGASGVFQFMPRLWPWFSETAGWKGANVFDARANVAVAAYIVAHFGW